MRAIVVIKKSLYQQLSEEGLQNMDKPALKKAKAVHKRHEALAEAIRSDLVRMGMAPYVIKGLDTRFEASAADLVITVGGDGTLLAASHYVGPEIPILGINSDPKTSVGHFCSHTKPPSRETLLKPKAQKVTRMEVLVRGRSVEKRILNEALFSHAIPAATSKFILISGRAKQASKSSGIWIGTGAGSTGALASAGGNQDKLTSKKLQAIIREPYFADRPTPGYLPQGFKRVLKNSTFQVINQMSDGMLYLDGPFLQVPVGLGDTVTFRVSKEPLLLVS